MWFSFSSKIYGKIINGSALSTCGAGITGFDVAQGSAADTFVNRASSIISLMISVLLGLVAIRGLELTVGIEVLPSIGSKLHYFASLLYNLACRSLSAFWSVLKFFSKSSKILYCVSGSGFREQRPGSLKSSSHPLASD